MQTLHESKPKGSSKKWLAICASLVLLLSALAFGFFKPSNADASISMDDVNITTVKRGNLVKDVRAPGNLVAKNRQWLSARVSAKVIKRVLELGAAVTPDSVILKLSSPELLQEFKRAQIEFKVVNAQLNALKETQLTEMQQKKADVDLLAIEKEQALEDVNAKKQLRDQKIIPQYQYNEAVLKEKQLSLQHKIATHELGQLPSLQASLLKVEQARVEQQQLQVDLLQEQVSLLEIRAGIHGILQSISVEEGQEISQGMELARVADQNSLKAELRVQESQAKDIEIGQSVEIDTRRSKFEGIVSRIDPAVVNGTVTVDIELPNELPTEARPDLRVNGTIEIQRLNNVLLIDKPAHWQNTKTAYLYKLTDNATAIRTQVAIGNTSSTSIQLTDGLVQGDRVILSNLDHLDAHDILIVN